MGKVRGQVSRSHISSQGRPGTIQGLEGSADFLVRGGRGTRLMRLWGGSSGDGQRWR